jgi:hypothetical protein
MRDIKLMTGMEAHSVVARYYPSAFIERRGEEEFGYRYYIFIIKENGYSRDCIGEGKNYESAWQDALTQINYNILQKLES